MLHTKEEALDKTSLGISAFRRYLRFWEEIYCSLPTDVKGCKIVAAPS